MTRLQALLTTCTNTLVKTVFCSCGHKLVKLSSLHNCRLSGCFAHIVLLWLRTNISYGPSRYGIATIHCPLYGLGLADSVYYGGQANANTDRSCSWPQLQWPSLFCSGNILSALAVICMEYYVHFKLHWCLLQHLSIILFCSIFNPLRTGQWKAVFQRKEVALVAMAMQDKLTRIAIVSNDKCKPKRCKQECKRSCPVVRMGKLSTVLVIAQQAVLIVYR